MDEPVRVLVIDDDPPDARATATSLERVDRSITARPVTDTDETLSHLASGTPTGCIVCGHEPSGIDGIDVLEQIRRIDGYSAPPFILFTDAATEELLSRAISAGVSEYIEQTPDEACYEELVDRIHELTADSRSTQLARQSDFAYEQGGRSRSPSTTLISPMQDVNLHRFAESNLVGTFLIQNLSFTYVNEELATIFGYTCEELCSEVSVPDIIYEDDRASVLQYLQWREWDLTTDPQYTFRGVRKDDSIIYVEIYSDRIDAAGTPSVFGLVLDVTARKQREKELERYEQMVDTAGDIVYALDPNGHFTFVNETAACITGYSREEVLGQHVSLIIDDEEVHEGKERIQRLLNDESGPRINDSYEITLTTAAGTTIPCRTNITLLTANGSFNGTVGVVRNITKQKEYEDQLLDQRDHFAALFENIPEPTVQYIMDDGAPVIKATNPAFKETFGYCEEQVAGESLDAIILPLGRDEEATTLNERISNGDPLEVEVCRQTKDGLRDFKLSNAPISIDETPVEGYAIYRDITERKRREYKLQRQNKQLDEFASVVSHDLRQPLGIAYGRLSIIREEYTSHHLNDIEEALNRMESLIENVLTLARQGKVVDTPTPTALEDVVCNAWSITSTDAADFVIEGPLAEVNADEQRLQELFENLFRNAIEHGGTDVTITVGMLGTSGFYIEDDGPGIPPDVREHVFERGYSTTDNGTGLGLVIVRVIVEAHGWSIDVTEGTAGGARFEIRKRPY